MTEIKRNFKLHDSNKLEMRILVLKGDHRNCTQIEVEYFTEDGELCVWAGHVIRYIYQDSTEKAFVGYHGDFSFEEYKRGIEYVDLAYTVAHLPLDTILNNRKEINRLILDMPY